MKKADDAFRTISEVADELSVPKHVLRFWEGRFPQLRPLKRGGGRRYYRPGDLVFLKGIRFLLHDRGLTIKGVQRLIQEEGTDYVKMCWSSDEAPPATAEAKAAGKRGRSSAASTAGLADLLSVQAPAGSRKSDGAKSAADKADGALVLSATQLRHLKIAQRELARAKELLEAVM